MLRVETATDSSMSYVAGRQSPGRARAIDYLRRHARERRRLSLSVWLRRVLMLVRLQRETITPRIEEAALWIRDGLGRGGPGEPPNLIDTRLGPAVPDEAGLATDLEDARAPGTLRGAQSETAGGDLHAP